MEEQISRRFHLVLGYLSVALGTLGLVLPLLPTTPFILLATWCFARSNPALADWLYSHPRFGTLLSDWRDQGAISRKSKVYALVAIGLSYASTVWFTDSRILSIVLALMLGGVALYLVTRPSPCARPKSRVGPS
jgi:uncharacterized membrane protein YbaN (DUF454 family)